MQLAASVVMSDELFNGRLCEVRCMRIIFHHIFSRVTMLLHVSFLLFKLKQIYHPVYVHVYDFNGI